MKMARQRSPGQALWYLRSILHSEHPVFQRLYLYQLSPGRVPWPQQSGLDFTPAPSDSPASKIMCLLVRPARYKDRMLPASQMKHDLYSLLYKHHLHQDAPSVTRLENLAFRGVFPRNFHVGCGFSCPGTCIMHEGTGSSSSFCGQTRSTS